MDTLTLLTTLASLAGIIGLLYIMVIGQKSLLESWHSTRKVRTFLISVGYPACLSKRFASSFLVQIFLPKSRNRVAEAARSEFVREKSIEHIFTSNLTFGQKVKIKLFSPEIMFSDLAVKVLDS